MILKAEGVARPPLLASSCGRAGGHLDSRGQEESSGCPRFLGRLGTAPRVCRAPCGSGEVSPAGQDPDTDPGWAGRELGAWEGCSAPLRMGLEEGRAVTRGMPHSRGHIPLHKSGIICRGSGKMWAMTHILSRNMSWAWTASPLPAILGVGSLYCMISTAQRSPRAWPAIICPYVWFFNEPGEKQIKPKVTLEGRFALKWARLKESRAEPIPAP